MPFPDAEAMYCFSSSSEHSDEQMPLIKSNNKKYGWISCYSPILNNCLTPAFFQPPNICAGLNGICTSVYLLQYKYSCQHL